MTVVRGLLGDISGQQLGVTNSHDHLFFRSVKLPGQELTDIHAARQELEAFRQAGGRTVVQWTPPGLGRRRAALARIAQHSGVQIISATGRHRREHYSQRSTALDDEALSAKFIGDLQSKTLPSGLIKVGLGFHHLDAFEKTSLRAAAAAHLATGAPIALHLELGTAGALALEYLSKAGINAESIILGHLGRNPDPCYLRDLASSGAWLGFEGPSRANHHTDWRLLPILEDLAAEHHHRILLGGDTTTAQARSVNAGPGMPGLLTNTGEGIRNLFGESLWEAIFISNPPEAFRLRATN